MIMHDTAYENCQSVDMQGLKNETYGLHLKNAEVGKANHETVPIWEVSVLST